MMDTKNSRNFKASPRGQHRSNGIRMATNIQKQIKTAMLVQVMADMKQIDTNSNIMFTNVHNIQPILIHLIKTSAINKNPQNFEGVLWSGRHAPATGFDQNDGSASTAGAWALSLGGIRASGVNWPCGNVHMV